MGKAIPRRIRRHTHPAARPEATPPPKPSGIDYLGLVAARVAAEQARRIAYADMASADAPTGDGDGDRRDDDDTTDDDDTGEEIER